jgi:5-methyltetrahydrofolate--homocysteine methyltransferase
VRTVEIDGRVRVVGERLNPTGKKRLKQALADKDYDYIEDEAIAQINAGAEILEVNMGLPDIDEREVLLACVKRLEGSVNVPLMIDCTDAKIIEDVVRACRGKPIINSVNGEAGKMREIFPIVKKYGTAVVALTLDENGIPESVEGRLEILDKIIAAAESYGIARERIIVDCLTLTVSAMQDACLDTLAAMRIVKERYGLRMTLGVSNISFGLPERSILTGTFLSMAMLSGLDAPIMDPLNRAYMNVIKSGEVLLGSDRGAEEYIGYIGNLNRNGGGAVAPGGGTSGGGTAFGGASGRGTTPGGGTGGGGTPGGGSASGGGSLSDGTNFGGATSGGSGMASGSSGASGSETSSAGSAATAEAKTLNEIIRKGFASRAAEATKKLLEDREPLEVIEDIVLPALEHVGNDFERGEIFLPQMIKSAETAKNSFEILRAAMSISGKKISYGRIILATVKDDIHDIGKNIVKAIMENYGYDVVDLGKDVPPELVVKTARDEGINFVGLSALMTTTVVNMARTIKMLRDESVDCVVAVGGAVLTADYARKIGADYYCRNAMDAVHAANGVFKK